MAIDTPFVALNARERKKLIGSMGSGARSSHATKAASSAAPAAIGPSTVKAVQPAEAACTMP